MYHILINIGLINIGLFWDKMSNCSAINYCMTCPFTSMNDQISDLKRPGKPERMKRGGKAVCNLQVEIGFVYSIAHASPAAVLYGLGIG